ncbi:MAG: apolipoprotein N-acyltransferase [Fimbriimonadaceae bacterium]
MATLKARLAEGWPTIASALLFLLAFPPFNLSLLVFVALVPWLLRLKALSPKQAAVSGMAWGAIVYFGQMFWVAILVGRWVGNFALGLVPLGIAVILAGSIHMVLGLAIQRCWARGWAWGIPLVWAGFEAAKSFAPGIAFPWALLATPLTDLAPLIQLAWFGTIYAVSAWLVWGNVLAARFLSGEHPRALAPSVAVFGILLGVSLARFNQPIEGESMVLTAGQPGVDLAFGDSNEADARLSRIVPALQWYAASRGSRLLVLPEGLVMGGDGMPPAVPFELDPALTPVIFGGQRVPDPSGDIRYQSAYAFDGRWQYADKTRLVVFGEYVPLRDRLPFLDAFRLPTGDLTAADTVRALDVGGLRVGALICFEAMFHDVAQAQAKNRSQVLAVMAIDDWYRGSNAPEILRTFAVWRAVETGLPVVRSGSLGYSMVIDARGVVEAMAQLDQTIPLSARVVVPPGPDRFPLVEFFPWAAGLALAASLFLPGRPAAVRPEAAPRRQKRGRAKPEGRRPA